MKILVLDNYDSFTYNLVHQIKQMGFKNIDVFRNDQISLEEVKKYDKIILSPGPGIPSEAGILLALIKKYAPTKSILGVCLGEQAIGEVFGATLINLKEVYHGVKKTIKIIDEDYIFSQVNIQTEVGRYHSWVVGNQNFPTSLVVTAIDSEGQIMALKHKKYDVHGVQFHPESILTKEGNKIIENFLTPKPNCQ